MSIATPGTRRGILTSGRYRTPRLTLPGQARLRPSTLGRAPTSPGAPTTVAQKRLRIALRIAFVCGVGYLSLGRPFAYIGISALNLYIGEACLVASMIYGPTRALWRRVPGILRTAGPLHLIGWAVVAQLAVGVVESVRGVVIGHSVLYILKNLPFNYLPLFLIPGLWAGSRDSDLMRRILVGAAWVDATYGVLQVVSLSHSTVLVPGTNVILFDLAPNSGLLVLAILGMNPKPRFAPYLLVTDTFVMLAHQVRAEWVAFTFALLLWLFLTRRIRVAVVGILAVVGLLGAVSLSGVHVAGAGGRGGTVSFSGIVGRAIAPFAPGEAAQLLGTSNAKEFAGTADWRKTWWHAIDAQAKSNPVIGAAGHGYGYPLASLGQNVPDDVRTPHDVYYYALGYEGWIGDAIFFFLLLTLARGLWKVWKADRQPIGLLVLVFSLGLGLFGEWFETPYGGVPTYLLIGIALASLITPRPGPVVLDDAEDIDPDSPDVVSLRARRLDDRQPALL